MADIGTKYITQHDLMDHLQQLGITHGQTIMVHSSMKAIGNLIGGPNIVMQALIDTVTPDGTLMMYLGWENIPDYVAELAPETRQFFYDNHPPFDPATARSARDYGIFAEIFRSWPGTLRSGNPEASIGANGKNAEWIVRDHPLNYGYGSGSPLAKLVESGGKVLLLGAPLDTITLLHYAEAIANIRPKQTVHYQCSILQNGQTIWVEIDDYNTGTPHADYRFEQIAEAYLAEGKGQTGTFGNAQSVLFDARDLVDYTVKWLEERFGED